MKKLLNLLKANQDYKENLDVQTIGFLFACALIIIGFITFIICEGSMLG